MENILINGGNDDEKEKLKVDKSNVISFIVYHIKKR